MSESPSISDPSILEYSGSEYIPSEDSDQIEEVGSVESDHSNDVMPGIQKTRKRKKNPGKKEERKTKRNSGKAYVTSKGTLVVEKTFSNPPCNCRLKCNDNVTEEQRKMLFDKFYSMGTFQAQNAYICGLCQQGTPKTHRVRDGTRCHKKSIIRYCVQLSTSNVRVCKEYFLKTFQISDGRCFRALKKIRDNLEPGSDFRGKHPPANKISDDRLQIARNHIGNFPAYQSHYTRAHNPNRKYLSEHLNIRLMYKLYKEHCATIHGHHPVSEAKYRNIFNFEFNLHFHSPHKDTCMKCDVFKMKLECCEDEQQKKELETSKELHLRKAELARQKLNEAKELSKTNNNVYALTFDLQKALPFPTLTCSIAYYKRNMYVYNVGCHELSSGSAYMYAWDETTASRGSQEIASCLVQHLRNRVTENTDHVIMFSDSCGGQNRNIKVALACMHFLHQDDTRVKTIDHKFMTSGHSFLPNDADFGVIETHSKGIVKNGPQDWYDAITKAKRKKPYCLKVMEQKEILSTAPMEKVITRRRKNTMGHKASWLKIQWLRYLKEEPYKIFYKETLNEEMDFDAIDITLAKKGRRVPNLGMVPTAPLYSGPRPVTTAKKQDMLDLLPFIPPINHDYFVNLNSGNTGAEEESPIIDRDSGSEDDLS